VDTVGGALLIHSAHNQLQNKSDGKPNLIHIDRPIQVVGILIFMQLSPPNPPSENLCGGSVKFSYKAEAEI